MSWEVNQAVLCAQIVIVAKQQESILVSSTAIHHILPNIFAAHKLLAFWLVHGTYYCSGRCTKARSDIADTEALVNPQLTGGCSEVAACLAGSGWAHTVSWELASCGQHGGSLLHTWAQGILRKGLSGCNLAMEISLLVIKADEWERKSWRASNSYNPFQSLLASYSQIAAAKIWLTNFRVWQSRGSHGLLWQESDKVFRRNQEFLDIHNNEHLLFHTNKQEIPLSVRKQRCSYTFKFESVVWHTAASLKHYFSPVL